MIAKDKHPSSISQSIEEKEKFYNFVTCVSFDKDFTHIIYKGSYNTTSFHE